MTLTDGQRIVPATSGRSLLALPTGELQERLVFMADELDHFRAVCHNLLEDFDSKGPRIRLRVVDSKFDVQQSVVHTPESFGYLHRLCIRAAPVIEPSHAEESEVGRRQIVRIDAMEIVGLDDKSVTVPSTNGVTVPIRRDLSRRRKRTAVHVEGAGPVIRLGGVENLSRRLDDLHWLRIDVVLKRTLGQAQPIGIVQALRCGALLLELRRPRLEWQPLFESRARVATRYERRPPGRGVRVGTVKSNPDAGQVRLAIGRSRRRCVEIRLTVRPFRNSWFRMQRPLRE